MKPFLGFLVGVGLTLGLMGLLANTHILTPNNGLAFSRVGTVLLVIVLVILIFVRRRGSHQV